MEDRVDTGTRNAILKAMVEGTKKKEKAPTISVSESDGKAPEDRSFGEMLAESLRIKEVQDGKDDEEMESVREVATKAAKFNVIKEWRF